VLASTRLPLSRLENVANQKFFRAPVRFDFLATGRENGAKRGLLITATKVFTIRQDPAL
jgi:hypothetical protein